MRRWLALAGFVALVGALAFIALSRASDAPSLEGRWNLVRVDTPEGTFESEEPEWIEFEGNGFAGVGFNGRFSCVEFAGTFAVSGSSGFALEGWGSSMGCVELEGTSYAFDTYFGQVTEVRIDSELILQSSDGSVRFVFTRDESSANGLRAW